MSARNIAIVVAVLTIAAALAFWLTRTSRSQPSPGEPVAREPLPRRVTAEVLNAGGVPGAARGGAQLLRHAGLDVVYWTTDTGKGMLAQTQVLVRRGDTTGVGRITDALGHAPQLLDSADAKRLVDLTVKLGRDYSPPPDRFKSNQ